jgi:hypothetical protein
VRTDAAGPRALPWLAALSFATVSFAVVAQAGPQRPVLLLEPATLDALGREALSRLEGELRGAEFAVVRRELASEVDPRQALERESREQLSAFAFALAARGSVLRLWLYDGAAHHLSVQDWQGDDPHVASVLAVQGVELLRARLAEPAAPVVDAPSVPASAPARRGPRLGVELGLGSMFEPGAHTGSFLPLARVSLAAPMLAGAPLGWGVRLGVAALGSGARLQAEAGRARVSPSYGWADAFLSAFPSGALSPFATIGVGLSRLQIQGSAEPGFYARDTLALSPIGGAGLGLLGRPFEHIGVNVEAQSWFALDPTQVRIDSHEIATFGRPSLLLSATLGFSP